MKNNYEKYYSQKEFRDKVNDSGKQAGSALLNKAFLLYHVLENKDIPAKDKGIIKNALGYFIYPEDIIPDFVPAVGFNDDMDFIIEALGKISKYVDNGIRDHAAKSVQKIFPKYNPKDDLF